MRKKVVTFFWGILIVSVFFGVYNNVTAVDKHTIQETTIIEQQLLNTGAIESFVERFATEFHSWGQSRESQDQRNEQLRNYMTEELHRLNLNVVRSDIPTTSAVQRVQIWDVTEKDEHNFEVLFTVERLIEEESETQLIESAFVVNVHQDEIRNLVITSQTVSSRPQRSDYSPQPTESEVIVDAQTATEITDFLEMFFALYPQASEQQLRFYDENQVLPELNQDLLFVQLINPIITKSEEGTIRIQVSVDYLCQKTKTI